MSDAVEFPISLDSDLGRELMVDCARFREGLLDEKAIRKKYRFDEAAWEALGNDEMVRAIEEESARRVCTGQLKREKSQALIIKAPAILDSIASDVSASPRHRVDAIKTLDVMAANGPTAAAAGPFFEITINLGSDVDGKPVIEHYRKPIAIDINPRGPDDSETNDDVDTGVIAAIAAKKSTESGGGDLTEEPVKQSRKNADLVSRWKQKTEAEAFLTDVLANGPMPTAIIEELGAARKFNKKQLWHAKQRIGATAFKRKSKTAAGSGRS